MTNIKKVFALLLAMSMIFVTGCNNKSEFVPQLYDWSMPSFIEADDSTEINLPTSTTSERSISEEIEKIFKQLCSFYGIEKATPEIRQVTADDFLSYTGGTKMDGCYLNNIIYVLDTVDLQNTHSLHIVVHELLHYLSDNGENRGFRYKTSEGNTLTYFFNEGTTDYLASEFVNENVDTPYDYQRILAKQLSVIVGEEEFRKAYFTSNVDLIKDLFNSNISDIFPGTSCEGVELDSFETFVCNFNSLWTLGNLIDEDSSFFIYQTSLFSCLEEEVFYIASTTGNLQKVKSIFSSFCMQDYELDKDFANEFFNYEYLMAI